MSNDMIRRSDALEAAYAADSLELALHGQTKIAERISALEPQTAPCLAASLAEAERKLAKAMEELKFGYDTLGEINTSNYDHDDVCNLNAKSVEVILSIKATLAELTGG